MFNYKNQNASLEDDFEFLRPNQAPPLPYSQSPSLKYQQNMYLPISQSPMPDSNFQSTLSMNETISKSVMFGIPRNNCPRPTDTRPSVGIDFHPANLGSPFVDITLNNCDELSLYQPMSHQAGLRHPTPVQFNQTKVQIEQTKSPFYTSNNISRQATVTTKIQNPVQLEQARPQVCTPNLIQRQTPLVTPIQNLSQNDPKPILKKNSDLNWTPNGHIVYNQSLYKDGSLFKIDDNFDVDEDDENDDEDDDDDEGSDEDENENIFSAALKGLKENNKDWSITTANQSLNINQKSELPKFEYKSLMIDDLDSFALNNNMSIHTRALAAKYLVKKENFSANDLNSQSLILPQLETQNLFQLYKPTDISVRESTSKKSLKSNKISSDSSSDDNGDDSEEDVWLFGKPVDGNSDKKKPKKKTQKDFSDQDSDIDRDVTNVLDIEKLKQLPKLL